MLNTSIISFLCKNDDTKTTVETAGKKQVWVLKSYKLYLNYTQWARADLHKKSDYKTTITTGSKSPFIKTCIRS